MMVIFKQINNNRIISFIIIFLLISFGLTAKVHSYDLEKSVREFTLENGLKVLMLERHLSPTISLYIRHRAGAVDEISGRTGTAHLLEHMMFKGTKTIGTKNFKEEKQILDEIRRAGNALDMERAKGNTADKEKLKRLSQQLKNLQKRGKKWVVGNEIGRLYTENGGVSLNASTGQDLTTYHISLPSNKIELWARIESDRMTNPIFREFYSERDVVMEERKQTTESVPARKLMEQFLASAFIAHPYRRPVLGWASDMRFLNIDYTKEFFNAYYAPNNTVIAVVGDISPDVTIDIIKKYFGKIPGHKLPLSHITEEPEQKGERRIELAYDANPRITIGYHKPTLPSLDDYVFDVIDSILSRGRTSRLFKTLVEEKGIAESINTANGIPGARFSNLFTIFATPRYPHTTSELEDAIYKELEKLKMEPVTTRELEKIKNQLKADSIKGLNSNSGLASKLSYFEAVAGDFRYITRHIKVIEKITPEDIMRTAKKYFNQDNRTVAVLKRKNQ
ncbi:MAG: pitrilysin family protein [Thermodesulfobacteriota bacterium]|nr:pitrilysin family protein [Thermodesulfobacteriota bacterium]